MMAAAETLFSHHLTIFHCDNPLRAQINIMDGCLCTKNRLQLFHIKAFYGFLQYKLKVCLIIREVNLRQPKIC